MHPMKSEKKLNIFLVNFDWRDIYQQKEKTELIEKLERDRLGSRENNFFFFSWAKSSYAVLEGQYRTVHQKSHGLEKVRPLLDMWSWFLIPYTAHKHKLRPDAWVTYDFGMVPSLWICKKMYGGKLVFVLNNQPAIYSQTRKFGKIKGLYSWVMERIGIRFVDHALTINETLKKYIVALGAPGEKVTIFSMNTIDRDARFITESKKGEIRKRHNLGPKTKVLLTVARLEAEKNYPKLLELFAGLSDDHVLFALGRGSLLPELELQAEKLGIRDRVFFEGYVSRDKIWDYFNDADAFILLSKAEALGVVLWEAIVAGVPIVCSQVEGMVETVGKDKERGRVWSEASGQEGFNERVKFCTEESREKKEMLARAQAFVEAQRKNQMTINKLPIWG